MGKLLGRNEIKEVRDLKTVDVEVPEWNGSVRLREMSERERIAWFESTAPADDETDAEKVERGRKAGESLIVLCMVNEDGEQVLKQSDAEWLRDKNSKALDALIRAALKHNGIGGEAEEEGKDDSAVAENASS